MPNLHRVVITGIGAVTPIGNNIDEYLVGLQTGTPTTAIKEANNRAFTKKLKKLRYASLLLTLGHKII